MRSGVVLCALLLWLEPGSGREARADPDLGAAGRTLLATPLRTAGDLAGGLGLIAGAAVGSAGDALSLLDDSSLTGRPLGGPLSRPLRRGAFSLAWLGAHGLELLRGEDIERLPEPLAAHLSNAPFAGRLSSGVDGIRALALAPCDATWGLGIALLQTLGDRQRAARLKRRADDARTRALGPEPAPAGEGSGRQVESGEGRRRELRSARPAGGEHVVRRPRSRSPGSRASRSLRAPQGLHGELLEPTPGAVDRNRARGDRG